MRYGKMKNKGAAIILVAGITLCFLLLFAVLAIDFSRMYYVRGELQNAADSAALAGAPLLLDPSDPVQVSARNEAIKFALKNKAAGDPVTVVTDNSNVLGNNNDITVGYWDGTSYTAATPECDHCGNHCCGKGEDPNPVNAIEVRARRNAGSPGGSVTLLFGKLIAGLTDMGVVREAIAKAGPLGTPGISLCIKSCDLLQGLPQGSTKDLIIQKDNAAIDNGMAWTDFGCKSNVDHGTVADFIWGKKKIGNVCDLCITTTNAVAGGSLLDDLENAFKNTTYDDANKKIEGGVVKEWTVSVPIMDYWCKKDAWDSSCKINDPIASLNTSEAACPPGSASENNRKHVVNVAKITITKVNKNPNHCQGQGQGQCNMPEGVTINKIECIGCSIGMPSGHRAVLVK